MVLVSATSLKVQSHQRNSNWLISKLCYKTQKLAKEIANFLVNGSQFYKDILSKAKGLFRCLKLVWLVIFGLLCASKISEKKSFGMSPDFWPGPWTGRAFLALVGGFKKYFFQQHEQQSLAWTLFSFHIWEPRSWIQVMCAGNSRVFSPAAVKSGETCCSIRFSLQSY